jgi:hypothetical protein
MRALRDGVNTLIKKQKSYRSRIPRHMRLKEKDSTTFIQTDVSNSQSFEHE